MGVSDKLSETHAKHAEMRQGQNLDLLRLISEGKRPASQEENERPVGENGKPLEKLQLAPERDILRGGMPRWWGRGDQASTSTGGRGDQASTSTDIRAEDVARMSPSEQVEWCIHGGLAEAFGPDGNQTLIPMIMNMLKDQRIEPSMRGYIAKEIVTLRPSTEVLYGLMQITKYDQSIYHSVQEAMIKDVIASRSGDEALYGLMQMIRNNNVTPLTGKIIVKEIIASQPGPEVIREMVKIQSNSQIARDVRNEIDRMLLTLNTAPTTSSSEASSSYHAGPSRSSEQREGMRQGIRPREESSRQREQWLDPMSMVFEDHFQVSERGKQQKQEAEQRIQSIIQAERQKQRQEYDRFRIQLREAQQERDRARVQLREAQQEREQAQEQIRQMQQELEQTRKQLEEMRQSLQGEQNETGAMWSNRLVDTFWSWIGNANDALEGLQKQVERERRTPQESRERVQQLQALIQRRIWEQKDKPSNERLNALLKYPIEGILEDHQLVEQIYPLNQQPEEDRQALKQSLHNALRKRLTDLYSTARDKYRLPGLQEYNLAGEFLNQLQERMEEHQRPNQEWIDVSEDIQEKVIGRRPNRKPHTLG